MQVGFVAEQGPSSHVCQPWFLAWKRCANKAEVQLLDLAFVLTSSYCTGSTVPDARLTRRVVPSSAPRAKFYTYGLKCIVAYKNSPQFFNFSDPNLSPGCILEFTKNYILHRSLTDCNDIPVWIFKTQKFVKMLYALCRHIFTGLLENPLYQSTKVYWIAEKSITAI